jgi:hypothetical protein
MKKERKKSTKILIWVFSVIILAFAVITVIWASYYIRIWSPLMKSFASYPDYSVNKTLKSEMVMFDNKDYCMAAKPSFLQFYGNLQASSQLDPKTNKLKTYSCTVLIWPQKDKTFIYGVHIYKNDGNNATMVCESYYDPSDYSVKSKLDTDELNAFNTEKADIMRLTKEADKVFGIK